MRAHVISISKNYGRVQAKEKKNKNKNLSLQKICYQLIEKFSHSGVLMSACVRTYLSVFVCVRMLCTLLLNVSQLMSSHHGVIAIEAIHLIAMVLTLIELMPSVY